MKRHLYAAARRMSALVGVRRKASAPRRTHSLYAQLGISERLEERAVLTTYSLSAGYLKITGTEANDNIFVGLPYASNKGVINGYDIVGGNPQLIFSVDTSKVSKIELDGLGGNDTIAFAGFAIKTTINGGAGNDTITLQYRPIDLTQKSSKVMINGGEGDDTIYGSPLSETIHGDGGNDVIYGFGGVNWLYGDAGNDTLHGGDGIDNLYGGDGIDYLYGGDAKDYVYGESGDDYVYGENGDDLVYGGDGNDHVYGGDGNDTVDGQIGDDYVYGDIGDDIVNGGDGGDELHGGDGNDRLFGGKGNDTLYGEQGRDQLRGDDDADQLYVDAFIDSYTKGKGYDTVNVSVNFNNVTSGQYKLAKYSDFRKDYGADTIIVTLDLSSVSTMLAPVLQKMRDATNMVKPVTDFLNRPVPIVSIVAPSYTFGSVLSVANPNVGNFISAVTTLANFGDQVGNWNGSIEIGRFLVNSGYRNLQNGLSVVSTYSIDNLNLPIVNSLRNLGVSLPMFDAPQGLVSLLFGSEVPLVEYTLPSLNVSQSFSPSMSFPTGIFGVYAEADFGGYFSISGGMKMGLDSSGLWKGNALSGFYIRDASATVVAGVYAAVEGGIGFDPTWSAVAIRGKGAIDGTVKFTMVDRNHDGKLRLDEFPSLIFENGFKATGSIDYRLDGILKYFSLNPFDFGHRSKVWTIASGTLKSF